MLAPSIDLRSSSSSGIAGMPLGYASVKACSLIGLKPHVITVQVCCTRGPSSFQMVGLPEAPVREARVRVDSALSALGVLMNEYAITVNLAPADLPKSGATLDLALALGVLGAIGHFPAESLDGLIVLGELGLDASLQPMRGVLPQLCGTLGGQLHTAVVPAENAREAGLVELGRVLVASNLRAVIEHLAGRAELPRAGRTPFHPAITAPGQSDLSQVRGLSLIHI